LFTPCTHDASETPSVGHVHHLIESPPAMTAVPDPLPDVSTSALWMPGWDVGDLTLLALLPVMIACSGLISACETIFFGLSEAERLRLRAHGTVGARATDALLQDPAMLLISILLANTTINVLYFVVTSVLVIHSTAPAVVQALIAVIFLLLLVLGGEVGPKIIGDAARERLALLLAPPLYAFHRAITPFRVGLRRYIIAPLGRLTAPRSAPPELAGAELHTLVALTEREGVLTATELSLLRDLLDLRRRKVRDVMTPRVAMPAVPVAATARDVRGRLEQHRVGIMPVFDGNVDTIVGVVDARRFLLSHAHLPITHPSVLRPAVFVPEVANLEQLLELFRTRQSRIAIVVDEYGGTSGMALVEDVVKEVVGDFYGESGQEESSPQLIGLGCFRVPGNTLLHDFSQYFAIDLDSGRNATLSGLIVEELGRPPDPGDRVRLGDLEVEVESVLKHRVRNALIHMPPELQPDQSAPDSARDTESHPPEAPA